MEPTDEGNHATNPPSKDEIHPLCKKAAYKNSNIPMGKFSPRNGSAILCNCPEPDQVKLQQLASTNLHFSS